jgi:hypothetical protein
MKRMMLVCLAAVLCGGMVFLACDTGGGSTEQITISFEYVNLATDETVTSLTAPTSVEINKGGSLGNKLPTPDVGDYKFYRWEDADGSEVTADDKFNADATIKGIVFKTNEDGNLVDDDGEEVTDESGEPIAPPVTDPGIDGTWDWSTSDDSKENDTVQLALPKPPYKTAKISHTFPKSNWGGVSTISGEADPDNAGIMRPVTKTVTGPDGTDVTAFSFTGTVKVSKDNRGANEGSRFPLVGWEAVPDEETLANLKDAWAYSFWVRVNSAEVKSNATATPRNDWVFKTAVCAEGFANEQGHEFKHYFGNYLPTAASNFGANATTSMTDDLAIGKWHKITVVLDPTKKGYNLDQDNYIHQYNTEFEADFDKSTVTKLQWQIALQDQRGIAQRGGDPYDMPNGYFDYDLDFYDLRLYLSE